MNNPEINLVKRLSPKIPPITEQEQIAIQKIFISICDNGTQLALNRGGDLQKLTNEIFALRFKKGFQTLCLQEEILLRLRQKNFPNEQICRQVETYLKRAVAAVALTNLDDSLFAQAPPDLPPPLAGQVDRLRHQNRSLHTH